MKENAIVAPSPVPPEHW